MREIIDKVYIKRQPKIGDKVVALRDSHISGFKSGYEYEVVLLGNGYVGVVGDRMPNNYDVVAISDGSYEIFEIRKRELKETHEKSYRILGIPIFKRKIDVYEES